MIIEGFGLYNTGKYAEANKAFDEAINASDEALKINPQLAQALYEKDYRSCKKHLFLK
jgi:hypothetical protein